jgi:taurine dioxygenase
MDLDIRPQTKGGFFAEIYGADLTAQDDGAQMAAIKSAFLNHGVLAIRGQNLRPEDHIAVSRAFGPLSIHVLAEQLLPEYPEILLVTNKKEEGRYIGIPDLGRGWHTDQSYLETPAMASLLYALETPADGSGHTQFADLSAAYDALPLDMKRRIEGLKAEHIYEHDHEHFSPNDAQRKSLTGAVHPIATAHPDTGRRTLYLGPLLTKRVIGLEDSEGLALLDELHAHALDSAFVHTHEWRPGDLLIWDNRCTLHRALPYDDKTHIRHMHRTTVQGVRPT